MKKNARFFASALAFLALLGAVLVPIQSVMARKSLDGPWDMTNKVGGFYNEKENQLR